MHSQSLKFWAVLIYLLASHSAFAIPQKDCGTLLGDNLPAIILQMEKEGLTSAPNRHHREFANGCALSCPLIAAEALSRLHRIAPAKTSLAYLNEARKLLPLVRQMTGRNAIGSSNGLMISESMAVMKYLLQDNYLAQTTSVQLDLDINSADFFLMPNELLLVSSAVTSGDTGYHMILIYAINGTHIKSIDPRTGGAIDYELKIKSDGVLKLTSLSSPKIVLEVNGWVRVSAEAPSFAPNRSTQKQIEKIIALLMDLKRIVKNPQTLLASGQTAEDQAYARYITQSYLSFNKINFLKGDLSKHDPADAALALEARMHIIEIERLIEQNNFWQSAETYGLTDQVP